MVMFVRHEIDLKNYKIHTDLAIETNSSLLNDLKIVKKGNIKISDLFISKIKSKKFHKKSGNYITIEFQDVTDHLNRLKLKKVLIETLKKLLIKNNIYQKKCLVIGLGNRNSTPDSLGPKVSKRIIVTSHIASLNMLEKGFSDVSSYEVGVKGETGIESIDIIKGLISASKPNFLIVIDALASQSMNRLNKTIQLTDTGINPGSGVGNNCKEISHKTLKIPVIAIGVPTVIDLFTILKSLDSKIAKIDENYNLMVTPKEIDFTIENLVEVLSDAINMTLHESMSKIWQVFYITLFMIYLVIRKMRLKSIVFGLLILLFLTIIYNYSFKDKNFILKLLRENITNNISKTSSDLSSKPVVNDNIRNDYENIYIDDPLVYIYNTHETENYSNDGYKEINITPTVKDASFLLQKHLKDNGISSVVEESSFMDMLNNNNWEYDELYKVSRMYLENAINRYENVKLYIDLHRDSIKKNVSTISLNDKKYARVLFVVGISNENYDNNLKTSQALNEIIIKNNNISRGILKKTSVTSNGIYNQDLNENVILIEIGGYQNTYEEVDNSLKVLANAIKEYLNE